MSNRPLVVFACICLILALGGAIPAQAQNNVPPNFFGVSTTVCTPTQVQGTACDGQGGDLSRLVAGGGRLK
jgi:hypothetical protein